MFLIMWAEIWYSNCKHTKEAKAAFPAKRSLEITGQEPSSNCLRPTGSNWAGLQNHSFQLWFQPFFSSSNRHISTETPIVELLIALLLLWPCLPPRPIISPSRPSLLCVFPSIHVQLFQIWESLSSWWYLSPLNTNSSSCIFLLLNLS